MIGLSPLIPLLLALAAGGGEDLDDRELARRIRDGDRDAFRSFFDRYHGLLYGYLRRRGADPAVCDDLAQQAFVTIWERRAQIDHRQSLRAFLFKISYNGALNHFRDSSKFVGDDGLAELPASSNPEQRAGYAIMQEALHEVVEQLPERRRAVFELCFLQEFTYRETAEVLGISIKTVEHQMGAALKSLRAAFKRFADA